MAQFDNLGKAIGIAISKDEQGIRNLLNRNGVPTANIQTKNQLSNVFIESIVLSKGLSQDFANYIKSKDTANMIGKMNNLTGYSNVIGDFVPEAYNMSGNSNAPLNTDVWSAIEGNNDNLKKDSPKGGFFSGLNLADLINQATMVYIKTQEGKNTVQETEQIKLASQAQLNNDFNRKDAPKSNTGTIVVFGVLGLVVVGAIAFFVLKKK
jgi:hypothetical protein